MPGPERAGSYPGPHKHAWLAETYQIPTPVLVRAPRWTALEERTMQICPDKPETMVAGEEPSTFISLNNACIGLKMFWTPRLGPHFLHLQNLGCWTRNPSHQLPRHSVTGCFQGCSGPIHRELVVISTRCMGFFLIKTLSRFPFVGEFSKFTKKKGELTPKVGHLER